MRKFKAALTVLLFSVSIVCYGQTEKEDSINLIGHRGATGLMPENTIPGFKKALEFDVNGIELDVVISGDKKVVVSHEPWFHHDKCLTPEGDPIAKESQKNHLIFEMSYEEIARYDCGSVQNAEYPKQVNRPLSKPLLEDTIKEIEDYIKQNNLEPITYNIEIKSKPPWDNELQPPPQQAVELVYEVISNATITDRVRIFAFDTRVLNSIGKIEASIPRVYLIPKRKTDFEKNLSELNKLPDVYAPNFTIVDSNLVNQVHSKNMNIIPWTVNEYGEMTRLVDMGVDGIISDYPNYFKKLREYKKMH